MNYITETLADDIKHSLLYVTQYIPNSEAMLVGPYLHIYIDEDCVNHINNQEFIKKVDNFVINYVFPFNMNYTIISLDFAKKHVILQINEL